MDPLRGQLAALATAFCWTVTALAFESAGRRIGSLAVNLIRLIFALFFLTLFNLITRGQALPLDAGAHVWLWLSLSGLVGFTLGDLCLFRSYVLIGARTSTLFMLLVPPLSAVAGWALLGETLTMCDWIGMALTVGGVWSVVSEKRTAENGQPHPHAASGALLGLGAAVCQAVGLILSKYGMGDYSPFAATQIRAWAGFVGFAVLFVFIGWWPKVVTATRDRGAMWRVTLGSFFGPFLGVSLSLMAVQNVEAGIATTIMGIVPILIIIPSALLFKEKISVRSVFGACVAVGGVGLLFL